MKGAAPAGKLGFVSQPCAVRTVRFRAHARAAEHLALASVEHLKSHMVRQVEFEGQLTLECIVWATILELLVHAFATDHEPLVEQAKSDPVSHIEIAKLFARLQSEQDVQVVGSEGII